MTRAGLESIAWCVFYSSGIIGSLLVYGVLQERIMSIPYGDGLRFQDSVFLVFLNRLVAVIFAMGMVWVKGESYQNQCPLWKYLAISFSNVYASSCQYEALKYVSFPVQMLGKSFKMAPVMFWGMAVSGKKYKLEDWLVAIAVTGGITGFLMSGPISSSASDSSSSVWGLALLGAFLALDGFTSTFQEKLFKEHATTKYNQMLYVNLGSCVISSFTVFATGKVGSAINFLVTQPAFAVDASLLSASAVTGQWFIYSQVKEFGALVFAATMNVRQVTSILMSYIQYGHSITAYQALGLVVVFCGLFYKSCSGFFVSKEKDNASKEEKTALLNKDQEHEGSKSSKLV